MPFPSPRDLPDPGIKSRSNYSCISGSLAFWDGPTLCISPRTALTFWDGPRSVYGMYMSLNKHPRSQTSPWDGPPNVGSWLCMGKNLRMSLSKVTAGLFRDIYIPYTERGPPVVKNQPTNTRDVKRCGFDPWVRKIPWRRAEQPTPVLLPGESHGQRSPAGYSP